MGLFFVNEIVKGYEGNILVENMINKPDVYSIRIALKNGEVITKVVTTSIDTGRPMICESQHDQPHKSLQWTFNSPINSVEVSSTACGTTDIFNQFNDKKITTILDPEHSHFPYWSIGIQPKRGGNKTHNVQFTPLDINGVRFSIRLPSAESRMEGDQLAVGDDFDQEVGKLNEHFKGEFIG